MLRVLGSWPYYERNHGPEPDRIGVSVRSRVEPVRGAQVEGGPAPGLAEGRSCVWSDLVHLRKMYFISLYRSSNHVKTWLILFAVPLFMLNITAPHHSLDLDLLCTNASSTPSFIRFNRASGLAGARPFSPTAGVRAFCIGVSSPISHLWLRRAGGKSFSSMFCSVLPLLFHLLVYLPGYPKKEEIQRKTPAKKTSTRPPQATSSEATGVEVVKTVPRI